MKPRCVDCGRRFWRDPDEDWKVRCFECWLAMKARTGGDAHRASSDNASTVAELAENLPALIVLCHPDKHAGSAASTRVTQWLLTLRQRITRAATT